MLHHLVEYADKQGLKPEPGFLPKKVRWLIMFNSKGKYLGVVPASDAKEGREFTKAPHLQITSQRDLRQFLVDSADFALLYGVDKSDKATVIKHDCFVKLLRQAAHSDPFLGKVADALENPEQLSEIHASLDQKNPKVKPADKVTFVEKTSTDERIVVECDTWHNWWREYFPKLLPAKGVAGEKMLCMLTGEMVEAAGIHPKIKGLGDVGGLIDTTLVGFNQESFCSYGFSAANETSYKNAAVGKEQAEKYAAALNHLIANRGYKLAGAKVVYWYTHDVPGDLDPMPLVFGSGLGPADADEDSDADKPSPKAGKMKAAKAEDQAGKLLSAIHTGHVPTGLKDCRYCVLTLSGNAGRVVVRDWMEGAFEDLRKNIKAWFADLEIVARDGSMVIGYHKFAAVLYAMVRDLKEMPAALSAQLLHCAIQKLPLPYQAMARALARVRIDVIQGESPTGARMGLIKAYLIRKGIQMDAKLMEENCDPAYICGRLMAILANIQQAALGDVGAGVVQRYYAAASTTPALILGRLIRQAQVGHLSKDTIGKGLKFWFEQQLASVLAKLDPKDLPVTLSLEGQSLFAMGYYHQKAFRKTDDSTKRDTDGQADTETKE
jgi:CRISPR-associated protein Csd1